MTESASPEKRERILEAAVNLFRKAHRVRKVSIEDIAEEAHVSPTTIYAYFGTREALVAEVVKKLLTAMVDLSRSFLNSSLPFAQKFQAITTGKMNLASAMDDEIISKIVSQEPAVAKVVQEILRTGTAPLWHEFLAQGKAEGYIDRDLDENAFLTYLEVLIAGFRSKPDLFLELSKNQKLMEQISRLIFFGFMRKEVDLFTEVGKGAQPQQKHKPSTPQRRRKSHNHTDSQEVLEKQGAYK